VERVAAPLDKIVERDQHAAGTGVLDVSLVAGRSVVTRAFAASPLRWLTPRNQGDAAWVFSSTYGGGLVDGDLLSMDVTVRTGAKALLSTQASTKIYKTPLRRVQTRLRARVHEAACLCVLPDPVVPFAGSRSEQRLECDLAAEASLVLVDWLSSGRRARGERWQFNDLRNVVRVTQGGRLICHDAVALHASDGDLADRLGRFDALATVVLVGPAAALAAAAIVEASSRAPLERRSSLLQVAAPIGDGGAFVRIAGTSVEAVNRAIREALCFVPPLLGDDPWARKW
jgi:urease accessory protein